ncbi:hypothetical protein C8R45DRAFT_1070637 [Mycena sanguinolenta]|nr:hypothetical protein C8R45DRAFT_1070637 [Mycena sanguinolenta]
MRRGLESMSSINPTVLGSPDLVSVENQVRSLIAAAEANLERLTTQIRELSLLREKERSILATLRLMVVPIGKLPTELLVEIFKFVVDAGTTFASTSYYFKSDARATLRSALCLSQVSPYWRQIIHNAPQLWVRNFIEIYVNRESKGHYLDGLETLLARSNPLPISIALVLGAKDSSYAQFSKTMARIVTPTAHRWKKLNIDIPSLRSFNEIPSETFEALEDLRLDNLENQTNPVVAFQSSPRLRNFAFFTRGVSNIHLLCLPWPQLMHLKICDVSLSGCRAVLLQCNQLVSAEFTTSCTWESTSAATASPIITLPSLDQLSLTFRGVATPNEIHGVEAFLVPLALPSLKTLRVEFEDEEAAFWPTEARRSLYFRNSSISSEALIVLLRNSPALANLEVFGCWECITEEFWDALRYDVADPSPLAPKLKNLCLECVGNDFADSGLKAAIRSRWWLDDGVSAGSPQPRISRLESVSATRFGFGADSDDESVNFTEVKAQMQDMVDQGLNLELW